jgi:hypothetical protein
MIPEDIERWLADPNYGADWQDVDLLLAEVEFLPRLQTYLDDPMGTEPKKIWIVSALLELLEHDCPPDGGADSTRLVEAIKDTIRQHADIAEKAMSELGPIQEVVLRSILGLPIPSDYPPWVIDRAHEQGA